MSIGGTGEGGLASSEIVRHGVTPSELAAIGEPGFEVHDPFHHSLVDVAAAAGSMVMAGDQDRAKGRAIDNLPKVLYGDLELRAYARQLGGVEQIEEDLIQELAMRTFRFGKRVTVEDFPAWARRCLDRIAVNYCRKSRGREILTDEPLAEPVRLDIADEVLTKLTFQDIVMHLRNPKQREVIVLRYLLDWTPIRIAEWLGIPPKRVSARLHEAVWNLRKQGFRAHPLGSSQRAAYNKRT